MFHTFIPLIPLTLAGALSFRRKILAYGCPILLTLSEVLSTKPSLVYFFTAASLLLAVFIARCLKNFWGRSLLALAGYASIAVFIYELLSNLGVWIIAGCVSDEPSLYPYTLVGLLQCYRAALPYSAIHFLKDVPIAVLLVRVLDVLAGKFHFAKIGFEV